MAYKITDKPNAEGVSGTYPYGSIKDNTGGGNGVPVSRLVYTDMHQFFARIADLAGVVLNSLPDNATNGWQFVTALQTLINMAVASEAAIRASADTALSNAINVNNTAWRTDVTWDSDWQTYATIPLKFKVHNGMLIIMGGAQRIGGTQPVSNELMFTLPAGCRVSSIRSVGILSSGVVGTDQVAVLQANLFTDGTVTVSVQKNAGVSFINTPLFIDNICMPIT